MRLIGSFDTEDEAYAFYSYLLNQKIQNIYEPYLEEKTQAKKYRIWIYSEEDLDKALTLLEEYRKAPHNLEKIDISKTQIPPSPDYAAISEQEEAKWQKRPQQARLRRPSGVLTQLIILFCATLFFWNGVQQSAMEKAKGPLSAEIALTPLLQEMLFDYPASYAAAQELVYTYPLNEYKEWNQLPKEDLKRFETAEQLPYWKGIYPFLKSVKEKGWQAAKVPLMEKIREGEVWRLFSPTFLHRDFLHILFNMIWVWILLKQVEARLPKAKVCLLILILALLSNCAQYIASGPNFLGFSGVVVGLAGFIWMRQKRAPWEGYPLEKGTLLFILFFVLAMFVLEILMFLLRLFSIVDVLPIIANTAHIVGGLTGICLGKWRFFSRSGNA